MLHVFACVALHRSPAALLVDSAKRRRVSSSAGNQERCLHVLFFLDT
jgi:hypothetical protein